MFFFFFFNDTATTEIYTLSLHDALPICRHRSPAGGRAGCDGQSRPLRGAARPHRRRPADPDRKSTPLNSSHSQISYAAFSLEKKTAPGAAALIARLPASPSTGVTLGDRA